MIRCKNCGISYNDNATICLTCSSPLQKSTDKFSDFNKKTEREFVVDSDFISSMKGKFFDTNLNRKKSEKGPIATATPPPRRNLSQKNSPSTDHLYQEPISEPVLASQSSLELEPVSAILTDTITYMQGLNQVIDSSSSFEPDKSIGQINSLFGEIKVSEIRNLLSIVSNFKEPSNIYARNSERIFFERGYVLQSGYIVYLNLSELNLSRVPDNLNSLNHISILDLERNNFETFPEELIKLSSLEGLYLSENKLKKLSGTIGSLSNLKFFWLYDNELTELPPELSSLTNLELLDLRGNKLATNNINSIFDLKHLKFLSLESNNIRTISENLANLTELETLLIGENPIDKLPDIVNLKNLKELSIYSTKLRNVPDSLLALPSLKTLDIWNTSIKSDDWMLRELIESGVDVNTGIK